MKASLVSMAALAGLAAVVPCWLLHRPATARPSLPPATADSGHLLGRLPVAFVPNLGQWEHPARFVARFGGMTVFLQDRGWTFTLRERGERQAPAGGGRLPDRLGTDATVRGVAVWMTFAGARSCALVPERQQSGRHSYFLGSDPSRWRSDVPLHASVCYRDAWTGVDVRAREEHGHFEYDLILQPEADLATVRIRVAGADGMHVDPTGTLVLATPLGPVCMPVPSCWEEGPDGDRHAVACHYVLHGDDSFGFEAPGRRPGRTLVVDPGLIWSTYLGGVRDEVAEALAVDGSGVVTIAGHTSSMDFPTTPGAFDASYNGTRDVFVTRLSASGASLVYSTYIGGPSLDFAYALAVGADGAATVAGTTGSVGYPTTPGAFDTSYNGGYDAFVTRLTPAGSGLVYSTFLGGAEIEIANDVAIDRQGAAAVAGHTYSSGFPTTPGAFDVSFGGATDAFVVRLSPAGSSLDYATFLGGGSDDSAAAVAVDPQGVVTAVGSTTSSDFPTTPGAFDTSYNGSGDAFVTRLTASGAGLLYSTLLGGTAAEGAGGVAVDALGAAAVVGATTSTDFPTTPGAFDRTNDGNQDVFVARLSPPGSTLAYSTFLGGTERDQSAAIALDARGAATVAGSTLSPGFPTTRGAHDSSYNGANGGDDAFVTRLSPSGSALVYSTFLGGGITDYAWALALDAHEAATVAGVTWSSDYPTTPGAFRTAPLGAAEAFATRLDLLPTGVAAFGRSSPGCTGPLAISVTSMPQIGNAAFAATCGNAPPNAAGLLALTANRLAIPVVVLGAELWLDPFPAFVPVAAGSDAVGGSEVPLPIRSDPALAGARLFAQFFWAGPTSPPPCPPQGLSASNALDITIQP